MSKKSQQYQVVQAIGEGAYGLVLKCRNKVTGDVVAIKRFKGNFEDENIKKTMQREVKMLKMLQAHSGIVSLHEAFRRKGKLHLVFEYVEKNLLEVLQEQPSGLSSEQVERISYQLFESLAWCHGHGVIHRDVKPENILVSNSALSEAPSAITIKICDFGFARGWRGDPSDELSPYVATRWYRPPELVLGSKSYDFTVDTWAAACIVCEITDGQPLLPGQDDVDQLMQIIRLSGKLVKQHVRIFLTDSRFSGVVMPSDIVNDSSAGSLAGSPRAATISLLIRKYCRPGRLSEAHIYLLESCLRMDPANRPHSYTCIDHACFAAIRGDYVGINPPVPLPPSAAVTAVPNAQPVPLSMPSSTSHVSSSSSHSTVATSSSSSRPKAAGMSSPPQSKPRSSSTTATFGRGRAMPVKVDDEDDDTDEDVVDVEGKKSNRAQQDKAGAKSHERVKPNTDNAAKVDQTGGLSVKAAKAKTTDPLSPSSGLSVMERMSMAVSGSKQTALSGQVRTSKPFANMSTPQPTQAKSSSSSVAKEANLVVLPATKPTPVEKPRHKSVVLRSRFLFRSPDNDGGKTANTIEQPRNNSNTLIQPKAKNPAVHEPDRDNVSDASSDEGVVLGAGDRAYPQTHDSSQPVQSSPTAFKNDAAASAKKKSFMLSLFARSEEEVQAIPPRPADKHRFSFAAVGAGLRRRMSLTLESKKDGSPPTTASSSMSYSMNGKRGVGVGNASPRNNSQNDDVNESDDSDEDERTEESLSHAYSAIKQTSPIADTTINDMSRKSGSTLNARTRLPFKASSNLSPRSVSSTDSAANMITERVNDDSDERVPSGNKGSKSPVGKPPIDSTAGSSETSSGMFRNLLRQSDETTVNSGGKRDLKADKPSKIAEEPMEKGPTLVERAGNIIRSLSRGRIRPGGNSSNDSTTTLADGDKKSREDNPGRSRPNLVKQVPVSTLSPLPDKPVKLTASMTTTPTGGPIRKISVSTKGQPSSTATTSAPSPQAVVTSPRSNAASKSEKLDLFSMDLSPRARNDGHLISSPKNGSSSEAKSQSTSPDMFVFPQRKLNNALGVTNSKASIL